MEHHAYLHENSPNLGLEVENPSWPRFLGCRGVGFGHVQQSVQESAGVGRCGQRQANEGRCISAPGKAETGGEANVQSSRSCKKRNRLWRNGMAIGSRKGTEVPVRVVQPHDVAGVQHVVQALASPSPGTRPLEIDGYRSTCPSPYRHPLRSPHVAAGPTCHVSRCIVGAFIRAYQRIQESIIYLAVHPRSTRIMPVADYQGPISSSRNQKPKAPLLKCPVSMLGSQNQSQSGRS